MGLIREPEGIDLIVGPSILTEQDKQMIREVIANYKRTKKLPVKSIRPVRNGNRYGINSPVKRSVSLHSQ